VRGQAVGGQPDEHDEVGRVAGGGERAAASGGAVDGAVVVRVGGEVLRLDRLELHVRHGAEEHLRYQRRGALLNDTTGGQGEHHILRNIGFHNQRSGGCNKAGVESQE